MKRPLKAAGDKSEANAACRTRMVDEQLVRRDVRDRRVLDVMRKLERHRFAPGARPSIAYGDFPVAIGDGQTLSQPYIVAYMTQALELEGRERVLEVGTGSGYQTAVLASTAKSVYTVEIRPVLAAAARGMLGAMGYENIRFKVGDGRLGWPDEAPFDAILCTAAALEVPEPLKEQLGPRGRLVVPVGAFDEQELELHVRQPEGGLRVSRLGAVRFVPLV